MNNFNLKNLVIAVITLSILLVAGAFVFSLLNKQSLRSDDLKPKITLPPAKQDQATQSATPAQSEPQLGGGGGGGGESSNNLQSVELQSANATYTKAKITAISKDTITLETEDQQTVKLSLNKLSNRLSDTDVSKLKVNQQVLLRTVRDSKSNVSEAEIFINNNQEER